MYQSDSKSVISLDVYQNSQRFHLSSIFIFTMTGSPLIKVTVNDASVYRVADLVAKD